MAMQAWTLTDVSGSLLDVPNPPVCAIQSEEELRTELERLTRGEAKIVELVSPNGDCLAIGIGGPVSSMVYIRDSDPEHSRSATREIVGDEPAMAFMFGGTPTETSARYCLPFDVMIEATIHFFRFGEVPKGIEWENF